MFKKPSPGSGEGALLGKYAQPTVSGMGEVIIVDRWQSERPATLSAVTKNTSYFLNFLNILAASK